MLNLEFRFCVARKKNEKKQGAKRQGVASFCTKCSVWVLRLVLILLLLTTMPKLRERSGNKRKKKKRRKRRKRKRKKEG